MIRKQAEVILQKSHRLLGTLTWAQLAPTATHQNKFFDQENEWQLVKEN